MFQNIFIVLCLQARIPEERYFVDYSVSQKFIQYWNSICRLTQGNMDLFSIFWTYSFVQRKICVLDAHRLACRSARRNFLYFLTNNFLNF